MFREISRRGGEGDDGLNHLHHMEYRFSKIASVITFEEDEFLSEKSREKVHYKICKMHYQKFVGCVFGNQVICIMALLAGEE